MLGKRLYCGLIGSVLPGQEIHVSEHERRIIAPSPVSIPLRARNTSLWVDRP
jgi:hypothetical protein